MCRCNDQVLTFESMIVDPMFHMMLDADRISLDEVTRLYVAASQARAAQAAAELSWRRP